MSHKTKTNEQGMVSFLIIMIMMLVISLIVIGFSQVARRNQREALDRQLSTQAYYAAESGVNTAVTYLKAHLATAVANTGCTDFAGYNAAQSVLSPPSGTSNGVAYTCLMVDPAPTQLVKSPLNQDTSLVWPLQNSSGGALNKLKITWGANPTTASPACDGSKIGNTISTLPTFSVWSQYCNYGLLRVDLFDGSVVSGDAPTLAAATKTFYFRPVGTTAAGSIPLVDYPSSKTGNVFTVVCSTSASSCTGQINGLTSSTYYARFTMIYQDAKTLTASAIDTSGLPVKLTGAQAVVDSTGRAQDELRRIQVRVPLTSSNDVPTFALQSTGDICKLLAVSSTTYTDSCGP